MRVTLYQPLLFKHNYKAITYLLYIERYTIDLVLLAFWRNSCIRMRINTCELSRHSTKTSKQASVITLPLTNAFLKKANNYLT